MKNSSRFILVILLLVFSWWLQNFLASKPELIIPDKTRFANYYLEDFTLKAHNQSGQVKYSLQAKRLDHYEQDGISEIHQIHTELFNTNANWVVSATNAKLHKEKEIIEFYGDVYVQRLKSETQGEFNFKTEKLTLLTQQEIIQTDSDVLVKNNGTVLKSKGLIYNGQQGILELKADVKVTYVK